MFLVEYYHLRRWSFHFHAIYFLIRMHFPPQLDVIVLQPLERTNSSCNVAPRTYMTSLHITSQLSHFPSLRVFTLEKVIIHLYCLIHTTFNFRRQYPNDKILFVLSSFLLEFINIFYHKQLSHTEIY